MPPPCSEQRCSRHIGRRSRVPRVVTRPRLLTGESLNNTEEEAEESDENISPDAEKSEVRFTLERRQDRNRNDNDNSNRDNRDSDRPGRNRGGGGGGGDNNQDRRNGRENDSDNQGSRFRDNGDNGPPSFRQKDDGGGGKPGDNEDENRKGNDRNGDKKDDNGGGKDDNGKGKNGGDGNNNDNGGKKGGKKGGSSSDNTSSSSPPPPPSSTTTAESTTTETSTTTSESTTTETSTTTSESTTTESSTTTSIVTSTSTPAPESTTSSVLQPTIPTFTIFPTALADITTASAIPIISPSPDITSASVTDVAGSSASTPTPTRSGQERGSKGDHNRGGKSSKEGGLNPTSERILIAAGSIGVFIVFCFIGWIIYKTLKKSKQSGHQNNSRGWLSKLLPWRGRSAESNARTLDRSYGSKEPLPAYDFGNNNSMEAFGYYDQGKFHPVGLEGITYQPTATLQNGRVVWQTPEIQQSLQLQASLQNQYPQANGQTMDISDINSTMRSRMPDPYYNQSEFARQPSDAYNPAQRQVYRASEISSLSSGFGDGDIIMPPPNVIRKPPVTQVASNTDTNNRPFSWMSRTTTTSERPTRFRSVNSWVDQQKERIKRASSRARMREDVPAMPGQINIT
ncbi:hypothetical protein F4803DRAFT_5489 [Xylaria telfairii]|nr:hypothetical protein F4803DRAFT_5489 [Xylaria telfairii]